MLYGRRAEHRAKMVLALAAAAPATASIGGASCGEAASVSTSSAPMAADNVKWRQVTLRLVDKPYQDGSALAAYR